MKIEQIINNNVVISRDKTGNEVVVLGKGIGFNGKRNQKIDENKIVKIFVLKDEQDKSNLTSMIDELPYDVIEFGIDITEFLIKNCTKEINKRITLPLVDHIATTIYRYRQGCCDKVKL